MIDGVKKAFDYIKSNDLLSAEKTAKACLIILPGFLSRHMTEAPAVSILFQVTAAIWTSEIILSASLNMLLKI